MPVTTDGSSQTRAGPGAAPGAPGGSKAARRAGAGRFVNGLTLGLAAAVLLIPLLRSPLVGGIELKTLDARMRLRGARPAAPEIVIVAIDETSVDRLGQWPWPRATLARLIREIHAQGAVAIALDIVFSEPERSGAGESGSSGDRGSPGDGALAAAIRDCAPVILGYYFRATPGGDEAAIAGSRIEVAITPPGGFPAMDDQIGVEANIPEIAAASPHAGSFQFRPDVDGTVRRTPLVLSHAGGYYPSLALRSASVFLGWPISLRARPGGLPLILLGEREVPASETGELLLNFRGPVGGTFPYYPAADVLDRRLPDRSLRGRLVFIGATETGIGDMRTTPFDRTAPGVETHATVADNLIQNRFVRASAAQTVLGMLAMLSLGALAGLCAEKFRRPLLGALLAAGVLVIYAGAAEVAFIRMNTHWLLVLPLAAGALGAVASTVNRAVFVEARARQIRRTFQQFVSPAVVAEMLRDPDKVRLGGERRELSVLFCDIRGFTTLSEQLPPEKVVALLNEYLTPMTRVVIEAGGTVDKYMGDAIMAFFGAPVPQADHAERAARAALGMREALAALNARRAARGEPPIAFGIGINTGLLSVGNMGSEMIFDYTVIGDAANLGSRLEGLNKAYGTDILVSEFTLAALPPAFVRRELDRVRVKGRKEPVAVFELIGLEGDQRCWARGAGEGGSRTGEPPELPDLLDLWGRALAREREREFEGAVRCFDEFAARRPGDIPAREHAARSRRYAAEPPPADWDGAVTADSK